MTFTEPATFHVPEVAGHPYEVVAVFSRQGPPYFELIQAAHDNSVFSEENANQILYVGVWNADISARVEAVKRQGVAFEALLEDSSGSPFVLESLDRNEEATENYDCIISDFSWFLDYYADDEKVENEEDVVSIQSLRKALALRINLELPLEKKKVLEEKLRKAELLLSN